MVLQTVYPNKILIAMKFEDRTSKDFSFLFEKFLKRKICLNWNEVWGQKITENLKNVFRDAFPFFQSDYVETSLFKFYKKNLEFPVVLRGFVKDFCTIFYDLKSQRFYWTFWQFLFHCNAKKTVHVYETLGISLTEQLLNYNSFTEKKYWNGIFPFHKKMRKKLKHLPQ